MNRTLSLALLTLLLLVPANTLAETVGDLNCNGTLGFDDINPFVLALSNPEAYAAAYPDCDRMLADCNNDGEVDFRDINPFVVLLAGGTATPIDTQLAGNALTDYPFFEYVAAFNENASVSAAVDPTRYPAIVGHTGDIHVVAAKTAAEWEADPALLDVTPDGALTVTFAGDTIQQNTFVLTQPFDLDAGAGYELGLGYDVVIDLNQNGVLDAGDYIDGRSDEAGLYAVIDTTQPGPYAVTELPSYSVGPVFGIPSSMTFQNTFYPSNIAALGELPLIVISHGSGHQYTWYDHIGTHLASYGYVVMSHQNNNGPGIEYCSVTTLGHTDAFLNQLGTIGGGALQGHVDASRILWLGHQRGAEGVARAYDRLHDHEYTHGAVPLTNYSIDDIRLLILMAPTDFMGPAKSNPHGAPVAVWVGSGDSDITGAPGCDICQSLRFYDRATGFRHAFILQGMGNSWFHGVDGIPYQTGPCAIGQEAAHAVIKGYLLPLVEYYTRGTPPAVDYFWRQHEAFAPPGIPSGPTCPETGGPSVVVTKMYHNGAPTGNFVLDDYQFGTDGTGYDDPDVSSSGAPVTYTVENLYEGRLDDADTVFTWTSGDPMNGMTYAGAADDARGVVFDWDNEDRYYEQGVLESDQSLAAYRYLSFRAAQGTRHPMTIAAIEDLTFSLTLRDTSGNTSSINIGAYGGGVEEPYQRAGEGDGTGWLNEFETIRIRITGFLTNGSGVHLGQVEAVRFDVGPAWGSPEGRLALDDIELTNDEPPF